MLKTRDQFKEATTVYFRISGEEPLHLAVMLEQASCCYLFAKPPMLRKYGFHLVLSGDLYKKCDQMKHAIRTYRGALTVFKGTKWSHIRDHVHFHIGKWYAFLGMFDVAINHLLEVLACGHQSKTTQELFLRDFFQIVQMAFGVEMWIFLICVRRTLFFYNPLLCCLLFFVDYYCLYR
ncbi:trafficking protein particle complex subunit 8-like isoform X2 [Camellia sinensis]|uniref:trafficking protein particle complex subunit 8-like isoform X2 n=1 Tax=Camellia sinensis TaxID=4442 RepID=UPI001035D351|nr:trafficking protein particle complex subunit 8-like isoform X2 [Camellia sinensis]